MFDFKITADNGIVRFIRASDRKTAIKVFCESEGCPIEYVEKHCKVKKMSEEVRIERINRKRRLS